MTKDLFGPDAYENAAFVLSAALPWLLFRLLPVAVYAAVSRSVGSRSKLVAIGALAALFLALHAASYKPWFHFGSTALIYTYFFVAALGVHACAKSGRRGTTYVVALVALGAGISLWVPARVFPQVIRLSSVAFGWEFMLSSASYVMDSSRRKEDPGWREVAFFLLVNPVLVWSDRGQRLRASGEQKYGLKRIIYGLFGFWLYASLRIVAAWLPEATSLRAAGFAAGLVAPLLVAAAEYPGHAGRASLQIGLLRMFGWRLPERYVAVYKARSPADFWRRWNRYMGRWAERYLFRPTARWLRTSHIPASRSVFMGIAVCATFVGVGVVHDAPRWALGERSAWFGATAVFLVNGLVMLVWELVRRGLVVSAVWRTEGAWARLGGGAARILLVGYVLVMGTVLVPMLASN